MIKLIKSWMAANKLGQQLQDNRALDLMMSHYRKQFCAAGMLRLGKPPYPEFRGLITEARKNELNAAYEYGFSRPRVSNLNLA